MATQSHSKRIWVPTCQPRRSQLAWEARATITCRVCQAHEDVPLDNEVLLCSNCRSDPYGALDRLKAQTDGGSPVRNVSWLSTISKWNEEVVRRRLRPRAYENYEQIVRIHLIPHLGDIQLVKLTPERIYTMLAQLADAGKAANTIRNVHAVLRRPLNQALRWGKVNRNVATLCGRVE